MIPRMIFIPLMLPVITVKPGRLIFRARQVRLKAVDININDICARCFMLVSRMNICALSEKTINIFHKFIPIYFRLLKRKERNNHFYA